MPPLTRDSWWLTCLPCHQHPPACCQPCHQHAGQHTSQCPPPSRFLSHQGYSPGFLLVNPRMQQLPAMPIPGPLHTRCLLPRSSPGAHGYQQYPYRTAVPPPCPSVPLHLGVCRALLPLCPYPGPDSCVSDAVAHRLSLCTGLLVLRLSESSACACCAPWHVCPGPSPTLVDPMRAKSQDRAPCDSASLSQHSTSQHGTAHSLPTALRSAGPTSQSQTGGDA